MAADSTASSQETAGPASGPPAPGRKRRDGASRRERLAGRRRALGLTQEDLAALLKVERSTVVRWERGETTPRPWLCPRLAKALGISADHLAELLDGAAPASEAQNAATEGTGSVRQLPATVADFTGRAAELAALTETLDHADGNAPGTIVISAIGGTAGVGKTTLALHWAHRIADRFPDGQLHVNLRGFDPSGTPVTPEDAIRSLLDALGVPPERIPPSLEAQAGLYRSLVAGKRMLVILDNARDEQQTRPLLPASPGSLVVITSRNQLTGLAAAYGARLISLDVLTPAEAVALLTARIGTSRCAAEPEAVAEIAAQCAFLPLALAVTAARAAVRPRFPLSALATELRDAANRLDALDTDDPTASVRAVFSWSYNELDSDAARLFRLLGLHPGPDITVPAAASLAATDQPTAGRLLCDLTRAHLIAEHVPGRYAFHDLLGAYAAAQARENDSELDRDAAVKRVLDHYLHTALAAAHIIEPTREPIDIALPAPGAAPEPLTDHAQALTWLDAERDVLTSAAAFAYDSGNDVHAWQIPWAMAEYLQRRGHWQGWSAIQRRALAAALRTGETTAQAVSHRTMANVYTIIGDYGQAEAHYKQCLPLYQRLGNRLGQAKAHLSISVLTEHLGRLEEAISHAQQSRDLYRAIGDQTGETITLNSLGWVHALLGDYPQARALCKQAVALAIEIRHRLFEVLAWDSLGYAEHHLGNFGEATTCYQQALSAVRDFGDRPGEAQILTHLGDTRLAVGDLPQALDAWQQALAIFNDLEDPEADQVRAKLVSVAPATGAET